MRRLKRFKTARRLGPAVFEQTQTERFAVSEARKKCSTNKDKHRKNISAYGTALRDKQRVRIYYGLPERQFKRYAKESAARTGNPASNLYTMLERRLDNVVFRIGLARTHRAARQLVSHGHVTVNNRRIRVPSHLVSEGDVIGIREGSLSSPLFTEKSDSSREAAWIMETRERREWKIASMPEDKEDIPSAFNMAGVIEFYSR